jgi:hypothetical protein
MERCYVGETKKLKAISSYVLKTTREQMTCKSRGEDKVKMELSQYSTWLQTG